MDLETTKLMRELADLSMEKAKRKDRIDAINKRIAEIEPLIRQEMLIDGLESMKVGNVGGNAAKKAILYIHTQHWAKAADPPEADDGEIPVTKDDMRRRAIAAMEAVGIGNFVKRGWNTHTLSAWCRERIKEGEEMPPEFEGVIVLVPDTKVRVRSAQ